jgi:hypothetical protein
MTLRMMISLDLKNADTTARATFDKEMAARNWTKSTRVSTTWSAHFAANTTVADANSLAKSTVTSAATTAGITKYAAECLASNEVTTSFEKI